MSNCIRVYYNNLSVGGIKSIVIFCTNINWLSNGDKLLINVVDIYQIIQYVKDSALIYFHKTVMIL